MTCCNRCNCNSDWLDELYDLRPGDLARNMKFNLGNALVRILDCDYILGSCKCSGGITETAKKDLLMAIEFLKDELDSLEKKEDLDFEFGLEELENLSKEVQDEETKEEIEKELVKKISAKSNPFVLSELEKICNGEYESETDYSSIDDCNYIAINDETRRKLGINKSWWIDTNIRDTIILSRTYCGEYSFDITLIYTSSDENGEPKRNYRLLFSEVDSIIGPKLSTKFVIELPFGKLSDDEEEKLIKSIGSFLTNKYGDGNKVSCFKDLLNSIKTDSIFKFKNDLILEYDILK